jgi:hypothetical protein
MNSKEIGVVTQEPTPTSLEVVTQEPTLEGPTIATQEPTVKKSIEEIPQEGRDCYPTRTFSRISCCKSGLSSKLHEDISEQ